MTEVNEMTEDTKSQKEKENKKETKKRRWDGKTKILLDGKKYSKFLKVLKYEFRCQSNSQLIEYILDYLRLSDEHEIRYFVKKIKTVDKYLENKRQ